MVTEGLNGLSITHATGEDIVMYHLRVSDLNVAQ